MRSTLDPDTKEALRKTIRGLRARLLEDLHASMESEYRLSVKADSAGLREAQRTRRKRLEDWLDEQVRTVAAKDQKAARGRFRFQAEKEAAYTLLHRLVLLRLLEAQGLSKPLVVTGGWKSAGYRELREYAPELCQDETEGYGTLLELVYAELATELPGLYGDVGLTRLVPVRPETLRAVIEALDADELSGAWTDDTTLGWVYQFWNDPEREALDRKIADGRKIEPHEIASKTQMFTERYMVEWLLHNTLGQTWLAICEKNGWAADARGVLDELDRRRAEWRKKREAGEVALDALMPIEAGLEDRWKYWVPQPLLADAVDHAPSSIRDLKLLDPACGSGHFLVIAFDLLVALYREEARHRGQAWTDREIAESIVAKNLHGVDIDPRCIQIAAAALWLKAKAVSKDARLEVVNLVAPALRLADLPKDDPALATLVREVEREVGLPAGLTRGLVTALAGADYLGTLLRVDRAIDEQLEAHEASRHKDGALFARLVERVDGDAKARLLEQLERFLDACSAERDLGLRLEGEQLRAGVRFLRIVREGQYDVVVGNPPYQGLSKTERFGYVAKHYEKGKADLYAAFLERGLELAKEGGLSGLLTMRGWMFLGQFEKLRTHLLHEHDLRAIGDFDRGAFDDVPNEVLAVAAPVFRRARRDHEAASVAVLPTPLDDKSYDRARTGRKRAAVLAQVGRHEFDPRGFEVIDGEPIVYWWSKQFLKQYATVSKVGQSSPARNGLATQDNTRFVRLCWEVAGSNWCKWQGETWAYPRSWALYSKGVGDVPWFEPYGFLVRWDHGGHELRVFADHHYGSFSRRVSNEPFYFRRGIAFTTIGSTFSARYHAGPLIFGHAGASLFPADRARTLCALNSSATREIASSLNPGVHFLASDVNRLPVLPIVHADAISAALEVAFEQHEAAREPSVEFRRPGPSPWRYAQDWAQRAVDRPDGAPLPPYEPEYDPPEPVSFVSLAIGVALGRFGADGEGILTEAPPSALPHGILFVGPEATDSLDHPACARLHASWAEHGASVEPGKELRDWLRKGFFDYHRRLYESRPIYLPLSSPKRAFVAYVSIHRWRDDTLSALLAEHLLPTQRRLEGELADLRGARGSGDKRQAREAERRYADVQKQLEELAAFIASVQAIAERGAPPTDGKCAPRAADAPFRMDLDDGVMINSAALWPLLEPQWKDPKKWWAELATSKGKKDYDWAHLAARYWPARVDAKCEEDPSLAVAHACFWRYHPAKAFAWELRLQHEMDDPAFRIDEPESDGHSSDTAREAFLRDHPEEAEAIRDKENKRRARKAKGADEEPDPRAARELDYGEDAERDEPADEAS